MKYLRIVLIAAAIIIFLLPEESEAAISWLTYSDAARAIASNSFSTSGAIAYFKGSGLQANKTYRANIYDAGNNLVLTYDAQSDGKGVFLAQIKPSNYPASMPENWKSDLIKVSNMQLQATHNFTVTAQAIPEFDKDISSLGLFALIGVVYVKLKKRAIKSYRAV